MTFQNTRNASSAAERTNVWQRRKCLYPFPPSLPCPPSLLSPCSRLPYGIYPHPPGRTFTHLRISKLAEVDPSISVFLSSIVFRDDRSPFFSLVYRLSFLILFLLFFTLQLLGVYFNYCFIAVTNVRELSYLDTLQNCIS